ncbi:hypothetical protein S40285_10443 [Stachybotrys chlorohalonatus IBT 40285]|uniref:Uncharacterized protein n=1 Tax=Stachybotrys chlorohalonatus (strain IBT 40285) TaxID=1283841 RepID=A0A084QJE8_STAC4|nr:hypothetical protein S40285_10443 [Stachybotrys chlorohalonata IBT 40285]
MGVHIAGLQRSAAACKVHTVEYIGARSSAPAPLKQRPEPRAGERRLADDLGWERAEDRVIGRHRDWAALRNEPPWPRAPGVLGRRISWPGVRNSGVAQSDESQCFLRFWREGGRQVNASKRAKHEMNDGQAE